MEKVCDSSDPIGLLADIPVGIKESDLREEHHGAPRGMPPAGRTLAFPRKDNMYKKKESIPYDEAQT